MIGGNIRVRLLALLLPALLIVVLISTILAYFIAVHAATLAYDRALLDPALAMSAHLSAGDGAVRLDLPRVAQQVLLIDTKDELYFRIVDDRGVTVAGDPDLPPPPAHLTAAVYFDAVFRAKRVRMVALPVPLAGKGVRSGAGSPTAVVEIAETVRKRDRLIQEVLLANLLPSLSIAAMTVMLVWFGVARGLAPLNRLRQELLARSHRDLRPVPAELSPEETRPLIDAINELLARLRDAIGMQQRFIANAAHQLRTPLAAILTQAELLERAGLPEEHRAEVSRLHTAVTRAARLASQLLTLARADPADGAAGGSSLFTRPVDLEALGEELVQEWVPRADQRGIDLGFELDSAQVSGDATLLRELIRNLLDNALKYTPSGGAVTLYVGGGFTPVIAVEDNGPGIPAGERERVTERFYRLDSSPAEGSGLGLAIVREIAMAHGASLLIEDGAGGRGTRVSVRFAPPTAATSAPCVPAVSAAPTDRSTSR